MPTSTVDDVRVRAVGPADVTVGWPSGQASSRAVWPSVVLSMVLTGALYAVLYLQNSRYFFVDDRVADTLPKLMDIGRAVSAGEWPWLTTAAVNSGAHAIEYQNAVFNPVMLALSVPLSRMQDAALGAFALVLVHALLLAGSAAWLGRLLGLATPWSVAFAVSCGFQSYTVLWGAAAWLQALTSFAWFVLVVAACVAFHLQPKRRYGWTILLATYGCYTSGWPLAIPVLGLFVLALVVARLAGRADRRTTGWLAAWYAGGVLCSLVALYPLTRAFEFAARSSTVSNDENFNVVSLDGLLQFANPAFYGFFNSFGGYDLQELPHFYVAWFVLPVLAFWKAGALPPRAAVLLRVAVAMLALTALASLGPERLLVFRYPTRFLQYSSFFLLVLTAVLVAAGRFDVSTRRLRILLTVVGVSALAALQTDPTGTARVLLFAAGVAALCVALRARAAPSPGAVSSRWSTSGGAVVVGGTVAILLALALLHPTGRGADYRFPSDLSTVSTLSQQDYTLFYGTYITDDVEDAAGYHDEYHPSGTGLMVGDRQINGYSPLGHTGFREYFPMDDQGNFDHGEAAGFTRVDPGTGLSMLELLRVDQIIALRGLWTDDLEGGLGEQWDRDRTGRYTSVWRHADYTLPGLVSYASPGLLADEGAQRGCGDSSLRECVSLAGASDRTGLVVFARLWFPGYTATLDGEPLPIERHAGMLVSVVVPPDATGELELTYRSPHVRKLALLAGLVVAGLAAASYRFGGTSTGGAGTARWLSRYRAGRPRLCVLRRR